VAEQWMIYGANGFTGRLTAKLAAERGMTPILAGRHAEAVAALAHQLGFSYRVFDLKDPMVEACLAGRAHYLDITGEIDVFEAVHGRDAEAQAAGVLLIPGVGFDVVPSDCLAALLAAKLPSATHLELAFAAGGRSSKGTTKSAIEALPKGGRARIDGRIQQVPALWKTREVAFADQVRMAASVPWGDVSTAYYSTGIPNICAYMALPPSLYKWIQRAEKASFVLRLRPVQALLKGLVEWRVQDPDTDAEVSSQFWGEVSDEAGRTVTGTLTTPGGYPLTADSSLRAVARVLAGDLPAGAHTPSAAFGADFVRELEGVTVGEIRD
jgi:short subunit dehydrogenase-like uncharacterized protein